ncbi:hypothetical protein GG344DRAFT_82730 [Lentinula edodes]|nr:hypothetical protein GG344DRAFT_82730 [Lentinula edodes]
MSTSQTTPTTQPTASTSSCPADPPSPGALIDEDEDEIIWEALARVERQRRQRRRSERRPRRRWQDVRLLKILTSRPAVRAREQEVKIVERRRKLAEAATARSQGGNSMGDVRPIVEISRLKGKGKGKAKAQPIGEDPDDGDDNDEDQEPCVMFVLGSSIRSDEGRRSKSERRAGGCARKSNGADPHRQSALREANSKFQQYLRQLLRRQEDDHARLISMDTRMALMGMGEGPATVGLSRRTAGQRRRIVEESEEEEGEEEEDREVEKDGEGEEEEIVEETAPMEAQSEKGKGRVEE